MFPLYINQLFLSDKKHWKTSSIVATNHKRPYKTPHDIGQGHQGRADLLTERKLDNAQALSLVRDREKASHVTGNRKRNRLAKKGLVIGRHTVVVLIRFYHLRCF